MSSPRSLEITPDQLQRFVQLIRRRTGITINEAQRPLLQRKLAARLTATRLSAAHYLTVLRSELEVGSRNSQGQSQSEWDQLIPLITTGESFFFRDSGQLELLRKQLLPELIQRQRDRPNHQAKPRLRLWSAGCSSGEEAYSLAIVITELLPDWQDWDIGIIGTDINPQAIAKAKAGCYTPWSFRQVDEAIIRRHFQPQQKTWKIHPRFLPLVHFHVGNLLTDRFPNPDGHLIDLDLIICRNVFIYWDRTAITQIVSQFNRILKPGGYLITGHTELQGLSLSNWTLHSFPDSLVYQRSSSQPQVCVDSSVTIPQPSATRSPQVPQPIAKARSPISIPEIANIPVLVVNPVRSRTAISALDLTPTAPAEEPKARPTAADYCAAITELNADDTPLALALAQTALAAFPEHQELLYQLAVIAEAQMDLQLAKTTLRKLLYLYPHEIRAYLSLANVYAQLGDTLRSQKMLDVGHQLMR